MKATGAGSSGGCFDLMTIGNEDRLALQNLQIPVGFTNRTIFKWLFPRRFPTTSKQRRTTGRPDVIVTKWHPNAA